MKKLSKNELRMISGAGDASNQRFGDAADGRPSDHSDGSMKDSASERDQLQDRLTDVSDAPSDVSDQLTNI